MNQEASSTPPLYQAAPVHTDDESLLKAERIREQRRLYYWANRDKIRQQQREYYAKQDKAKHAARVRDYRNRNKAQTHAKRKEYRQKNRDKFIAWDKEYRDKNQELLRARKRAYWQANREQLILKKREYNRLNREKTQNYYQCNKERWQKSYEKNKIHRYNHTLNTYCPDTIAKIRSSYPQAVKDCLLRYPFEQYGDPLIRHALRKKQIFSTQGNYADCYDAGMMAYLYSVHRCAAMQYQHVQAYIRKVVGIYICCAAVLYNDAKALCKANNFRHVQLDAADYSRY